MIKSFISLLCLFFLVQCKTAEFAYHYPSKDKASGITIQLEPLQDRREDKAERLEKEFSGDLKAEILKAIREEFQATALVESVNNDQANANKARVSLHQYLWEVPDYKAIITKSFFIGLLTGGIGGLIYGSTSTEVHGKVKLHVQINLGNRQLLDRDYAGFYREETAKFKCDTPATKVRVTSRALEAALRKLKTDLDGLKIS